LLVTVFAKRVISAGCVLDEGLGQLGAQRVDAPGRFLTQLVG
jgi:hypothetical protein